MAFRYDLSQAWVTPLVTDKSPATYDLCGPCADRTAPPRGWELVDERPDLDARMPTASDHDAVRDAIAAALRGQTVSAPLTPQAPARQTPDPAPVKMREHPMDEVLSRLDSAAGPSAERPLRSNPFSSGPSLKDRIRHDAPEVALEVAVSPVEAPNSTDRSASQREATVPVAPVAPASDVVSPVDAPTTPLPAIEIAAALEQRLRVQPLRAPGVQASRSAGRPTPAPPLLSTRAPRDVLAVRRRSPVEVLIGAADERAEQSDQTVLADGLVAAPVAPATPIIATPANASDGAVVAKTTPHAPVRHSLQVVEVAAPVPAVDPRPSPAIVNVAVPEDQVASDHVPDDRVAVQASMPLALDALPERLVSLGEDS